MFRKNIILILLFLLLFALSLGACNINKSELAVEKNIDTKVPSTCTMEKVQNNTNQQKYDIKKDVDFKLTQVNCSKSDDNIKYEIKYPEISGLNDYVKQKRINSTLKKEALKVLKYYENPYDFVELNIDYKVLMKNLNVLSIQYSGVGSVRNAAHPNNLFFTTNINIKTGERLRLKDIINIDKDFTNKFLNGEFKAVWPAQSEALKHYTNEEILEYFKEADSLDNIGTELQSDVFSYFTNESFGISISVSHAIGDHAEFEIKYKDLKDNIKTQFEIYNDLH